VTLLPTRAVFAVLGISAGVLMTSACAATDRPSATHVTSAARTATRTADAAARVSGLDLRVRLREDMDR